MLCKGFFVVQSVLLKQVRVWRRLVKSAARCPLSTARKSTCAPVFFGQRAAGSGQRLLTVASGFTLLELMVAIVLFSMISTAAYKLFMSVTRAQEVTQLVLDDLDKLQRAEIVLEKDLFQITRRPIRDESGRQQPALKAPGTGGTLIEFTRSGWQNPLQVTRSTLQRVAYALEGRQLIRYYWPMLDRAPGSKRIRQTVMSDVNSAKFRFLDDHKRWISAWPPMQKFQQGAPEDSLTQIPAAVELTIVHDKLGSIVTVVPLATYKPGQVNKEGGSAQGNMSNQPGNIRLPRREGSNGY